MKIVETHVITVETIISEADLRARMEAEFLEQAKMTDAAGKLLPGVTCKIRRGSGGKGGYIIRATRDLTALPKIRNKSEAK